MNATVLRAGRFLFVLTFLWCGVMRADTGLTVTRVFDFPANSRPVAPLILASNQNFYGTLPEVATNDTTSHLGSVFQLTATGVFTDLVDFNVSNGEDPRGPLLQMTDGNFYGTTAFGGAHGAGTIFKMTPAGTITLLLSFNGTNGAFPFAGLTRGLDGKMYGTTQGGGTNGGFTNGYGTVFSISTAGAFSSLASFGLTNGFAPYSGLVLASNGNFYGTTRYGGSFGLGTVFVIGPDGSLANLVSFANLNGAQPGGLLLARDGNFYGVTQAGDFTQGTIFKMTPGGLLTPFYWFNGFNGGFPNANLMQANDGTIYGTTQYGGDFGQGTIFSVNTTRNGTNVPTTNITVKVVRAFDGSFGTGPQGNLVQAADGNLYGTTFSGGANGGGVLYQLSGFKAFIIKQPVNRTGITGSTATFTVVPGGSTPAFQWRFNGTNLTDDGHFVGVTNSTLTISNVTSVDIGSYSVVVANSLATVPSSNATLTVTADVTLPAVSITVPLVKARTTNAAISGLLTDNANAMRVIYWITNINNGVTNVSATNDATVHATNLTRTTWSATAALLPGTNILAVRSIDFSTNFSAVVTRPFFYRVPTAFVLTTNGTGAGTLTGIAPAAGEPLPTNGAMLDIGAGYTITAKADTHSFFTNWTGTVGTITNTALHFVMEPGTTVQANFVTNLFIRMTATYNGLFSVASGTTEETAGMVSGMTVSSLGAYAGKMLINGAAYAFSGKFNMGGSATNLIARTAAKGGPLHLAMYLDWNNSPRQVIGTVSGTNGGAWSADMVLIAATTNKASAEFTMLVPPLGIPTGTGYGLFTNKAGVVTATGKLADGTLITQTVPLSEIGTMPFYASLYANTGLLMGWLNFDNGSNTVPSGTLTWIKKAAKTPLLYTNGFTNVIAVSGSPWIAPARGVAALPYPTNAPVVLDITDGNLPAPLSFNVGVTTNNVLIKVGGPTNSLTGTIDPKTGLMTVTFGNGKAKATSIGYGAVLQNATNAAGYFLGTNASGSLQLHP